MLYTCITDGSAEVRLTLVKAAPASEELTFRWRKVCGVVEHRHMRVILKSAKFQNTSEAVVHGQVSDAFRVPCKKGEAGLVSAGKGCVNDSVRVEVLEDEVRSLLEVSVEYVGNDVAELPIFSPKPEIYCLDRRVCMAAITPSSPNANHQAASRGKKKKPPTRMSMVVKYICLKGGVSHVVATIHTVAHAPMDLVWTKRCIQPKAHYGRVLTAPQALTIVMVVGVALGCCVLCCCFIREKICPKKQRGGEELEMGRQEGSKRVGKKPAERIDH